MVLIESAAAVMFENHPARIVIPVTLPLMVSFYILLLVEFSILMRSINTLGNIMDTDAILSNEKWFIIGDGSLEILYFIFQHKYCVLYPGYYLELELVLELILLELYLLHEILRVKIQFSAIVQTIQNVDIACKGSIIQTKIIIGFEELQQ